MAAACSKSDDKPAHVYTIEIGSPQLSDNSVLGIVTNVLMSTQTLSLYEQQFTLHGNQTACDLKALALFLTAMPLVQTAINNNAALNSALGGITGTVAYSLKRGTVVLDSQVLTVGGL